MDSDYLAVIVGVMFDEKYEFEDIFVHGVAKDATEAFAITQKEVMRLYEDFGEHPLTYTQDRSQYDEPIQVVQYSGGYEHIYCYFPNGTPQEIKERRERAEKENEQ